MMESDSTEPAHPSRDRSPFKPNVKGEETGLPFGRTLDNLEASDLPAESSPPSPPEQLVDPAATAARRRSEIEDPLGSLSSASFAEFHQLYPFQSHGLWMGNHRMHYLDEGEGPPILMLHGNPTWSFYYRELVKGLRDRFRVVVPDHIGCGFSDKPQQYPHSLATHIDNLERLVDHLGLEDVTLASHDWGGAIGFGWAVRHPQRVRRFVVFNTAAFLGGPTPLRLRVCRWPLIGSFLVRRLNLFARSAVRIACKDRHRMTPDVARGYLLPYRTYADRVAIHRFVCDIPVSPRVPSFAVLQQIEAGLSQFQDHPMIIFWGGQDFCFNDSFLEEWHRRFPTAQIHRFPDAGHYVVEDAHERILPLLLQWITREVYLR